MAVATTATPMHPGKWYQHLYVQVLIAIESAFCSAISIRLWVN